MFSKPCPIHRTTTLTGTTFSLRETPAWPRAQDPFIEGPILGPFYQDPIYFIFEEQISVIQVCPGQISSHQDTQSLPAVLYNNNNN